MRFNTKQANCIKRVIILKLRFVWYMSRLENDLSVSDVVLPRLSLQLKVVSDHTLSLLLQGKELESKRTFRRSPINIDR